MIKLGSVIDGKYKILNEIGHGGMSTVYLAINEKANKPWAVKEVRKSCRKDFQVIRQSLIMEMELLKKLSHPRLPSIVDVIDEKENLLIVMDYIEGNTLEKLLEEQGAQKQEQVVEWAIQLCEVLEYLHTREPAVIYRDMKPANVMIKSDGSVVLIDFGTAREYKEQNTGDTTCLGTQGYAAPEQFGMMGQTDARTDIYCLGATMYHLVTGHNPSEPPYEMYPITKWNPKLSTGLEQIIEKCTCKNPQDRYQSVGELRYALEHYRDMDRTVVESYRKKCCVFAGIAGISLVCLLISAGMWLSSMHRQRDVYAEVMETAARTTVEKEALDGYVQAVAIDSGREEAYDSYCEHIIADGVFTDEEENYLLEMNISTEKYLRTFSEKNPSSYADFCYDIGNAYWFYYEHEESRQAHAVAWFEEAAGIYEKLPQKEMELQRSRLYTEIGSFYKKIVAAQIAGSDAGMYGDYWRKLVTWKEWNDKKPDRELITLRMYRELVTRSMEYGKYLREDGITRQEIQSVYVAIETDMLRMEQQATESVRQEILGIQELLAGADELLDSYYRNIS